MKSGVEVVIRSKSYAYSADVRFPPGLKALYKDPFYNYNINVNLALNYTTILHN